MCLALSGWMGEHGYPATMRDAVLAYVRSESGFRPDVIKPSGACLMQWAGERRRQVLAIGHGHCPDWRVQMVFADYELRSIACFLPIWKASPRLIERVFHDRFGRGRC